METFWVAETLKYLYMTISDYEFDLNKWVFNTEAHPLPVINDMKHCSNPFSRKYKLRQRANDIIGGSKTLKFKH